jgi:hypothetical protein
MKRIALVVTVQAEEWTCHGCRFLEQVDNNACCKLLNKALEVTSRLNPQRASECRTAERVATALGTLADVLKVSR